VGTENGKRGYRYIIRRITLVLVGAAILFVAAGTLHWVRGWIWVIYTLILDTGMLIVLARHAPETLNQRGTWHAGIKTFDKLFVVCWVLIGVFITPIVAGIDRRFEWSHMSLTPLYCGIVLVALSWPFGTWAMKAPRQADGYTIQFRGLMSKALLISLPFLP
jgi:hypothetical protein